MSFTLDPAADALTTDVHRVARSELDNSLGTLADKTLTVDVRIHEVRKSIKKLRALLRLIRFAFPGRAALNARLRDAAANLSDTRDAAVIVETLHRLVRHKPDLANELNNLHPRLPVPTDPQNAQAQLAVLADTLSDIRAQLSGWTLTQQGFDALAPGLAKTHSAARKAMKSARRHKDPNAIHDWRKSVKTHGYHALLLQDIWREMMIPHRQAAETLGDLLGQHRDLTLLDAALSHSEQKKIAAVIRAEREHLDARIVPLGALFLAEPTDALTDRWRRWWDLRRRS